MNLELDHVCLIAKLNPQDVIMRPGKYLSDWDSEKPQDFMVNN